MNKRLVFGFLAILLTVGIASGVLLQQWGIITKDVTVEQGFFVDENAWNEPIIESPVTINNIEGITTVSTHYLNNVANRNIIVDLNKECEANAGENSCNIITTNYYETNLRSGTLELSRKDENWLPIGERVTVSYNTDEDGNFNAEVTSGNLPQDYVLVYYQDAVFDNDGQRLVTPAKAFEIDGSFSIPYDNDGNIKPNVDYCNNGIDNYEHCKGAKLWLIAESEINDDNTLKWNNYRNDYYFETDLLGWNEESELTTSVTVPAGETLDFVIVNDFPTMLIPATYTITTRINPVEE